MKVDATDQQSFDLLCKQILSYCPTANFTLLKKSYHFAKEFHKTQKRSSGEPYLVHLIGVALLLAELQMDLPSIITGILHDTVEDTEATLEQVQTLFGEEIAELVDGVTKLSQIDFKTSEEKQAENFRKMILAMAKDIRVILIKLADRLNNMRTLKHLPPQKQKIIAQETLEIFAPIANQLGINWLKTELEDLAFRFLHPETYAKLDQRIKKIKQIRKKYIQKMTELLEEKLNDYDVQAQVSGKIKNLWSIFKKMERRQVSHDQVADILTFQIALNNITECYKAMGVIHATYKPIPGRFKDYIAIPKNNGYQALHTMVIGELGERIEIQLKTQEMQLRAEHGVTANWQQKDGQLTPLLPERLEWVKGLVEWHHHVSDPNQFLESVKTDLFSEKIFIFTPKGEIKQLGHKATPLDFAYAVHTDLGHHCIGAKVNGKNMPLKHQLRSGDTIEILTSPDQAPSKDWLQIVQTPKAKAKIRSYIREQERLQATQLGKTLMQTFFQNYTFSPEEQQVAIEKLSVQYTIPTLDELYIQIGYGKILPESCLFLTQKLGSTHPHLPQPPFPAYKSEFNFGHCCHPIFGDPIVGILTLPRKMTIHTVYCKRALDQNYERRINLSWSELPLTSKARPLHVQILAKFDSEFLILLIQTLKQQAISFHQLQIKMTPENRLVVFLQLQMESVEHFNRFKNSLSQHPHFIQMERH